MNNQDIELFPCYSLNLREFLKNKGIKYKISALNPNNYKMFWLYIDDDILKECLKEWKDTKPQV
ncbi:hypothetical protein [Clostridium sp.]|uniref:hypothetical protein n=1 Tax=Clostridium sp. TaxID=1506 RepID=UPI00261AF7F0|nr:hypothetical protein [Clostridium sp.]